MQGRKHFFTRRLKNWKIIPEAILNSVLNHKLIKLMTNMSSSTNSNSVNRRIPFNSSGYTNSDSQGNPSSISLPQTSWSNSRTSSSSQFNPSSSAPSPRFNKSNSNSHPILPEYLHSSPISTELTREGNFMYPIPSHWNPKDKCSLLDLSFGGCRVTYAGTG